MWFQGKKPNRRHRRRNVLDVKVRSDQIRAIRARGLAVMIGVVLGTVFTLYVLWRSAEWVLDRMVYENRAFAVRVIQVSTDGGIATEQLRRWSGVRPGQNLLALDLARVKSNLELSPNVDSVSVERLLPDTVRIRVTELKPIARVLLPRVGEEGGLVMQPWLLDSGGRVMMPLDPRHREATATTADAELPVLIGVSPNDLRLGRAVRSGTLLAALRFIDSFNRSGMSSRIRISQLDLMQPGVLVALTDSGAEVTLGFEGVERQLSRWREIHDEARRLDKVILTLDLAVRNNVPVRWVDAADLVAGRPTQSL